MIEKIAAHLADFTPRLQSNTRALYQYCPIPVINYPQLENELFCNIYYLKQLCDTLRFPDWPIKDPVSSVCSFLNCKTISKHLWIFFPPVIKMIVASLGIHSAVCLKSPLFGRVTQEGCLKFAASLKTGEIVSKEQRGNRCFLNNMY